MVNRKSIVRISIVSIGLILLIILLGIIGITTTIKQYGKDYVVNMSDLDNDNYDAIIVLGAGIKANGDPSDILSDRLSTAIDIFEEGVCDTFLLTGDHGRKEYDEVRSMKNFVMNFDVSEDRVFMDHAGFSTYDSIYRARDIFQVDKAIIVTNEYHLPRALYIARKMGIEAYGVASDKRSYVNIASYSIRETLAQIKEFVYVNILKPEPIFLGETIPINSSDGRVTDDELEGV